MNTNIAFKHSPFNVPLPVCQSYSNKIWTSRQCTSKSPNPSNLNVKWTRLIKARESSRIPWRCVSILNWFKNRRGNFIWGYRQGFYVFHFHVNVLGHILSLKPSFFFREYKLIRYVKFWLKLSSVNRLEHWTVLFRLTAS